MMKAIRSKVASLFSYDALNPGENRLSTSTRTVREDYHVRGSRHTALQENANDLCRNMSIAAWMIRKHCDYVAEFRFQSRNEDDNLNTLVERLMEEDSVPSRMDVAGRYSREKMFRVAEQRRMIGGDVLLVKLNDGRLQGIQADLVKTPDKERSNENWINGVLVNSVGKPVAYGVRERVGLTGTDSGRTIKASNAIHFGFFTGFANDQVRGISPIVSALNPLRDTYENFDYALARSKVEQLCGLKITLGSEQETDEEGNVIRGNHEVDFNGGPSLFRLAPGEDANFIANSGQPSNQFQDFQNQIIMASLKAVDIPFSFYREDFTNFFGSRAAALNYERSCKDKRADQVNMRNDFTNWKLSTWIRDGRLSLPSQMKVSDLAWEWIPQSQSWWDPAKELVGQVGAIAAGLETPQRVARANGSDFEENIKDIAKARDFAKSFGVNVSFAPEEQEPDQTTTEIK